MKTTSLYCMLAVLALCTMMVSCSNSYTEVKPETQASAYPAMIEKASKRHWYSILQSGLNIYTVKSFQLDQAKQKVTVTLDKVDSTRLAQFTKTGNDNSQAGSGKAEPQIFIHLRDSTTYTLDEPHTIPLDQVARIDRLH